MLFVAYSASFSSSKIQNVSNMVSSSKKIAGLIIIAVGFYMFIRTTSAVSEIVSLLFPQQTLGV